MGKTVFTLRQGPGDACMHLSLWQGALLVQVMACPWSNSPDIQPEQHQAIDWTSVDLLPFKPSGTNLKQYKKIPLEEKTFQNVVSKITGIFFRSQYVKPIIHGNQTWRRICVSYCPACRTTLVATRFWVVMICPIIKCLTVLEFSFILFDMCLFITIFNFILNYVPIVTFWIFTYHKIWILLIIFCFIWSYWIIYFSTSLEVFWSVVS